MYVKLMNEKSTLPKNISRDIEKYLTYEENKNGFVSESFMRMLRNVLMTLMLYLSNQNQ